jgi:hypothetical protein
VRRRSLRRGAAVIVAVGLVGFVALGTIGGLGIPGSLPAASPAAAATSTSALRLVSQTAWTLTGQPLTMRVGIAAGQPLDQLDLSLKVHRAVRFRSQFEPTLEGLSLGDVRVTLPDTAVSTLPPDAQGAQTLTLELPTLDPGVYPVEVLLRNRVGGSLVGSFVTYLIRVEDQVTEPLRVAWVQPVGAGPATQFDRTFQLDPAQASSITQVTSALIAHPSFPATLDITPETAAASVASGRADLAGALAKLVTPSRTLLSSPYVDVDASRLVDLGLGDDLVNQRVEGDKVLTSVIGRAGDPRSWSSDTALSGAALGRLIQMGVTTVVVPEAGLVPLDRAVTGGVTLEKPFSLAADDEHAVNAVSVDQGLTAHFAGDDPVLSAQQLLADLAVLYRDTPLSVRGVAIRPPRDWAASAALLNPVFDAFAIPGAPVRAVTVDQLVSEVPALQKANGSAVVRTTLPTGDQNPLPEASIDAGVGDQIRATHVEVKGVRSLTGPATDLSGIERQLLVAEADGLTSTRRRGLTAAVDRAAGAIRDRVHLIPGRTFRLTARKGTIPLTLVNDNPFPVTVTLDLSSDKLEFVEVGGPEGTDRSRQQFADLVLNANQHRVVTVPVQARASAAFPLRADLRSPSGDLDLDRVQFTVVSTAVPGVGIALSIGAGLVLVWWWVRHWRRTRALQSEGESDEPDETSAGDDPEPAPEAK